jgi:hypothetical protein
MAEFSVLLLQRRDKKFVEISFKKRGGPILQYFPFQSSVSPAYLTPHQQYIFLDRIENGPCDSLMSSIRFNALILIKGPKHTGLICVKTPEPNISTISRLFTSGKFEIKLAEISCSELATLCTSCIGLVVGTA